MHINIHQKDLIKAINIVESALSSKSVIESLKGIKIKVKNNSITFTTSKSEMAIEFKLTKEISEFKIEQEGEVIIPGFHFLNIINKMNGNYITLIKENNLLNIYANKTHVQLICYDINSYPFINFDLTNYTEINMNKSLLTETYNINKYAISNNQNHQILTGINYSFNKEELAVSTTDSLRMILNKINFTTNNTIKFTINKIIIKDIIKVLNYFEENNLNFKINKNQCLITNNNLKIKSRLLDGSFPEIDKIIPKNINFSYKINKLEIIEALQRVSLLTEKNESVVKANINDNYLDLKSSHKYLGNIEEKCQISNLKGSSFEIAFDPHFVLDALNTINNENIVFEFVDEISGFIIKDESNENLINVISPIRIN